MTTTSAVPAVIDWLVNAAQNSPLLGQATPRVNVFDGAQTLAATQALNQVLWIGCDAPNPDAVFADATQAWQVMDHARTKDEDGVITCSAQHWSGDPSVKVHRDGAKAIVGGVELLLRGDGNTGPGDARMGGLALWSGTDVGRWETRQIAGGVAVLCTFTVIYRARLITTGA
jgi:hypothetical protein